MKDGFIRAAVAAPEIQVADCCFNRQRIEEMIQKACDAKARMILFPELSLTGYTCGDLFLQDVLLRESINELKKLIDFSEDKDILIVVGLPLEINGRLYNTAAVLKDGSILGVIPKTYIPSNEEARYFASAPEEMMEIELAGQKTWFGTQMIFECDSMPAFKVCGEIGEDLWAPLQPSLSHALAGASVIFNTAADEEVVGRCGYRHQLVEGQSARLMCSYLYASAGEGESTTDLVFSGECLIAENGTLLAQSKRFVSDLIYTDIDLGKLYSERRKNTFFRNIDSEFYVHIPFHTEVESLDLIRDIPVSPFVPASKEEKKQCCEEILTIQAMGLKKRLKHAHCDHAVVGISGGLDSTLALIVTVRAFDALGLDRKQIQAVTMPCFGTTDRTYQNACQLVKELGAELSEVNIKESVMMHFRDIGQNPENHDVTYENSQARERTQVLMDLANQCGGLVIGTGDLSELALGWATYNGDHMSMYGVNASVPKTLVRHVVAYYAEICGNTALKDVLLDILDTPVSPELIPPEDGRISQKTEDLVGPYELHDFYLYYMLRFGFTPSKIYRMACKAFEGIHDSEEILKWLKNFYHRFFMQQFKRSCVPDGPKVGTAALSPRGGWVMPSDASANLWKAELDQIGK